MDSKWPEKEKIPKGALVKVYKQTFDGRIVDHAIGVVLSKIEIQKSLSNWWQHDVYEILIDGVALEIPRNEFSVLEQEETDGDIEE